MSISEDPWTCEKCGTSVYPGFARCTNSDCRSIRPEFLDYVWAVVDRRMNCVFSGAETDVVLPSGDPLWAPYVLEFVDAGWLSTDLMYTQAFYDAHPTLRLETD